jgi:hypothetical protein
MLLMVFCGVDLCEVLKTVIQNGAGRWWRCGGKMGREV